MRINLSNYIPFQKKLVANCSIQNNNKQENCHIYQLDQFEDQDYFEKLVHNKDWQEQQLLDEIDSEFKYGRFHSEFYALETQRGKCLGYAEIDIDRDENSLIFIETMPSTSSWNSDRKRKYIGETLLSFLVQMTKKSGKKLFSIVNPTSDARPFYKKCHFLAYPDGSFKMRTNNIDEFIRTNNSHTASKIEFV